MFETLRPGNSLAWDCVWQSTLFLGLGLFVSMVRARHSARAHRFLLMAMLAALVSPVLTQAAWRGGWGLLARAAAIPSTAIRQDAADVRPPFGAREPIHPAWIAGSRVADTPNTTASTRKSATEPQNGFFRIAWRRLGLGVWLALTVFAASRLVTGFVSGLNVVRLARSVPSELFGILAFASAERLGVRQSPELRVSPRVRCPAIWCWGRRPVILLPEGAETVACSVEWAGVFCHELAHWARRDQWADLLAEVLVCALPWHPLAWWARRRLSQLGELACDDWVLATGLQGTDYAESLLSLVPDRRRAFVLTAVSNRRGLAGRIKHILDDRRSDPVVGTRWTCAIRALLVLVASAIALAQTRPVVDRRNDKPEDDPRPSSRNEAPKRREVSGKVLGPDGKPISGATVVWVSYPMTAPLNYLVIPDNQPARPSPRADVLAETRTGANGRFRLTADFDPDRYHHQDGSNVVLLVMAPGMGMLAYAVKVGTTDVELRLSPEVVIRGRLLTPDGTPAAGVRVTLHDFFNDEMTEGTAVGKTPTDDLVPRFWPKPRTTDAEGRFTFDAMPRGAYVHLDFWPAEYALDEVTVATTTTPGIAGLIKTTLRTFEVEPVQPTFTHRLAPARPVTGRVTDTQSGQPLAGMLVGLTAMGRHGNTEVYSRTGADGRYRVSGQQADSYRTTAYPPADSGYLATTHLQQKWPAGTTVLEKDFALRKGQIVRGRVIDGETRQPIAGAAVRYKPRNTNPKNRRENDPSSTVLTDTDGRFAITMFPGRGVVATQTPSERYMRVSGGPLISAQGIATIDVPINGEVAPLEITVRKGAVLRGKVVGPDGTPVPEVAASCDGIAPGVMIDAWEPSGKGIFRLPGADPSKIYRVFFIQADRQLGAVAVLKPSIDSKEPVEVTLRPTACVHGKVITDKGSPADGAQVQPMIVIGQPKEGAMTRSEMLRNTEIYVNLMGQKAMMPYMMKVLQPRKEGDFVIDTLVPGVPFVITAGAGRREGWVSVPPLKPGENRDLGTITLKERTP